MFFSKLQLLLIIKSFSSVFKPSIDYSSHKSHLEGPMEVWKEKESIPLLRMFTFFPPFLSLQERHICSEGFFILFQIVLEQKRSLTA